MNYELFCYSQHFITLPYERVRLTETAADEYLYKIMSDTECDIAVNIDEDAFVVDEQAILDLVNYVIENDYANAGMADGGELPIRIQNPIVTNPFFNVLNLRLIRQKYSVNAVLQFEYKHHEEELKSKMPAYLLKYKKGFESVDFEPYYPFFFWLAYNFKTLYLPAEAHSDGYTTILCNNNHKPILYHTWYSRRYKEKGDDMHTNRIKNIISEVSDIRGIPMELSLRESFLEFIYRKTRKQRIRWNNNRAWFVRHVKKGPRYYINKWLK